MTQIYFVRHADSDNTDRNESKRSLTEKGKEDAKNLISFFENIKLDHIYSSPYKRTIDTVTPFAKNKNQIIKIINDFREQVLGHWLENYRTFSEKQWNDFSYTENNAETLTQVQHRNIKSLNNLIQKHPNETIAIGTHGVALATIINFFEPKADKYKFFRTIANIRPLIYKAVFQKNKFIKINKIDTTPHIELQTNSTKIRIEELKK